MSDAEASGMEKKDLFRSDVARKVCPWEVSQGL